MRISSSMLGMESTRRYSSVSSTSVGFFVSQKPVDEITKDGKKSFSDYLGQQEEAAASEPGLSLQDRLKNISKLRNISDTDEKKAIESIKMQCLQYLLYWLYGGRKAQEIQDNLKGLDTGVSDDGNYQMVTATMEYEQYHYESEETSFSTTGTVLTKDGREINFQLELSMSRSFEEYYKTTQTTQMIQKIDPLVINLDGNIASLSDQKFEFDIDSDGVLDTISYLNGSSGYLALDKNEDGMIGDGSELFGTKSGDGFYDLSLYDEDGNGWIDEDDEIFHKLLIWTKDENGKDELYHLKDKGIGAICLSKVQTEFDLNSLKDNRNNGQVKSTGVYLYEDGTAGSMQQLDLAI